MDLVWPAAQHLPGYVHALQQGWSPDHLRPQTALDELVRIAQDPEAFLSGQVDREATGPPIILPDGSAVPRLPGYSRWMWDGEFCGSIGFRWQVGTSELPAYCLGHIGYSVVPWKRGRGYATRALRLLLPHAREEGLHSRFLNAATPAELEHRRTWPPPIVPIASSPHNASRRPHRIPSSRETDSRTPESPRE
jgi:predicted acetyltransferase